METNKTAEEMADRFMKSGKTIGGGDAGWIRAAYIEGHNDASQQSKEKDERLKELEKLLIDAERCIECQLENDMSRGAISSLLQRIKLGLLNQ